jgi:AcrR family transcriptional regulator
MSSGERREQILDVAIAEFARGGLHGTSTEAIAARAGVSQPYIFRLFGTKRDLFLAATERCFTRIEDAFTVAAEAHPDAPLAAMGEAYMVFLGHRDELLLQLHTYAACDDEIVRETVSRRYHDLVDRVQRLSGASPDVVRSFFAVGMFLNVVAATGMTDLVDEEWLAAMCAPRS